MPQISDLADLVARAKRLVGKVNSDELRPGPDDEEEIARDALDEFSRTIPRRLVHEQAGDDETRRYDLAAVISDWIAETSQVLELAIVYDVGTDDERIAEFDDDAWDVRLDAAEAEILFVNGVVSSTATFRVVYTRPHEINGLDGASTTTVAERWTQPLALITAATWASWISRAASDLQNETLGVDQVDYGSVASRWAQRAKELRAMALERMSPTELTAGSAAASVEYDTQAAIIPIDRVSH